MAIQNVTDAYVPLQTAGKTYNGNESDQTYSINPNLIGSGDTIVIVDQGGQNSIELVAGLEIVSSQVIANQAILTLSNGAVVDIRGADTFNFKVGQNLAGGDTEGTEQTFADFAQNVLGVTVPAEGVTVPAEGGAATINDDGTAGEGEEPTEAPSEEPTDPSVPGESFTLTAGVDFAGPEAPEDASKFDNVIQTTDRDDTIEAVASSLTSARTLNPTDQIDGGEGEDTLKVSLDSSFTGFTGTGKMVNVETLELSNAGTIARGFDATGATGIKTVKANGANAPVTVTDLAALAAVELTGQKSGNFSVTYDSKSEVVTGTQKDAQALTFSDVGTAEVPAAGTTAKVDAKYVNVTVANVESSVVTSNGTANFVNLAGVVGTEVAVNGAADIGIKKVNAAVTSFDATAATGKVNVDFTGVTANALKTIAMGSGDDKVTVDAGSLVANAEINGGAGNDTLVLKTGATNVTLQPTLAGFETVQVGGTGVGALTISAKNSADLSNLVVDGIGAAVSLVNTNVADLTVTSKGAEAAQTVTTDNAGAASINFVADAATVKAATAADDNKMITTLTKANELTVNVGSYVAASGAITAGKAENVTLNVGTGLNAAKAELTSFAGVITSTAAQSFTVNATGTLASGAAIVADAATSGTVTTGKAANLKIDAKALESLNVDANGAFILTKGSNLSKVQTLTVDTDGVLDISAAALTSAANVTVTGANNASSATLGTIGNAALDHNLNVTASGLTGFTTGAIHSGLGSNATVEVAGVTGAVTIASVTAGKIATVNADGALGLVTLTGAVKGETVNVNGAGALKGFAGTVAIDASKAATFVGSELKANKAIINGEAEEIQATLNGGIGDDDFTVNLNNAKSSKVTLSGDLDIQTSGSDTLTVNLVDITTDSQSVDANYNVAGVEDLTFTFKDESDTVKLSSSSSLEGVEKLTVTTGTLDVSALANAADFAGITNVKINSGLSMTAAQLKAATNMTVHSDSTGDLQIKVSTKEEAEEVADFFATKAVTSKITAAISYAATASSDVKEAVTSAIKAISDSGLTTKKIEEADDGAPTALDVSGLKGKGETVDLSEQAVAANASYTLTLAEINDAGNKGDLEGDQKSDFTIKLPALSDIEGTLTIKNMTISGTENKPNDVIDFGETTKGELLAAIQSITVKAGAEKQGGDKDVNYTTLEIDLKEAGSIVLENVIKSTAEAGNEVTWTQLAGAVDGISTAGVISNTDAGEVFITGLVTGLVDSGTFEFAGA